MLFALTLSAFAAGSAGPVSFNPVAGRVEKDSTLTITSTNATAICYTTDNSEPSCKDQSTCALSAETDIKVTEATTIKAIGCNESKPSDVATASYTINACKKDEKCQADEKCEGYKSAGIWNNLYGNWAREVLGKCVNANPTFAPLSTAGPVPADQAVTIKASVSTAGTTVCYTASKDTASKTDATCGTPADSGSGLAGVCGNDSEKYDDTSKPKVTTNHLIFSAIECLAANTSIGPVEQTYVLAPTPAPTTGPTPAPAPTTGPTTGPTPAKPTTGPTPAPAPTTGPTTGPTPAKPTRAGSYMLMPLVAIVSALMSL